MTQQNLDPQKKHRNDCDAEKPKKGDVAKKIKKMILILSPVLLVIGESLVMGRHARLMKKLRESIESGKKLFQDNERLQAMRQVADDVRDELKRRSVVEQSRRDAETKDEFMQCLGLHNKSDDGAGKNVMTAADSCRKAAEQGLAPARQFLDECLGKGEGLSREIVLPCKVAGRGDGVAKSAGVGTETVGDYTWSYRIIGDRAEIYKDGSSPAVSPSPTGEVAIPSTLGGKPVTSIGDHAFSGCSSLASVIIPSGVTNIGHRAFSDCRRLTNLTIPDGLTHIWGSAFFNCSSLTNVSIPDSVTYIGAYTFSWCSALTNMTIPRGVTRIKSNAFRGCSNLVSVAMSNGVTGIEDYAFLNCTSLTSVKIPSSMRSIGNKAFYNSALKVINLPKSREGKLNGCKFPEKTKISFYADE